MPLSPETEQRMQDIEKEQPAPPTPEEMVEPKAGWQCPTCGAVYDKKGTCPMDQSVLVEIDSWKSVAPAADETSTEEVMETADELYPEGGPRPPTP